MGIIKTMIIGDVHGSKFWMEHIKRIDEFDRVIFLGDYFDDWENDWINVNQIDNLKEIINFKNKYKDKIIILLGNHDLGYVANERMSGQQEYKFFDIKEFLVNNIDEFMIGCRIGDWVFSHAGFSAYWMKKYGFVDINDVNEAFKLKNYDSFLFFQGDYSRSGEHYLQSPLWIRPEALKFSSYYDKQVVGHTATDNMQSNHLRFKGFYNNKQEIYIVDKNDHSGYLELDIK